MEQTLEKQILARNFTYQDLIRVCKSERPSVEKKDADLILSRILDCDWDAWRDRAQFDYNVPAAYFDLPRSGLVRREITGQQRYIEVATFYKILPESGVRRDRSGEIYGIYEAYTGILEALFRNDPVAVQIFFPRLKPQVAEYFRNEILTQRLRQPWKYRFAAFQQLAVLLFGQEEAFRILLLPELRPNSTTMYGSPNRNPPSDKPYYMPPDSESRIEVLSANKSEVGPEIDLQDIEGLDYLISSGCRFALSQFLAQESIGFDAGHWILSSVFRSGDEEMFEKTLTVLRKHSIAPFGERTLADTIRPLPFEEVEPNWDQKNLQPFPVDESLDFDTFPGPKAGVDYYVVNPASFMNDAIFGCNPNLVDFCRAAYGYSDRLIGECGDEYEGAVYFVKEGYQFHHNAVGAYQVLQRINGCDDYDDFFEVGNVDLINFELFYKHQVFENDEDAPEDEKQIQVLRVIEYSFGNLSVLLNCLQRLQKESDVGQIRRQITKILADNSKYAQLTPLSFSLLENFVV